MFIFFAITSFVSNSLAEEKVEEKPELTWKIYFHVENWLAINITEWSDWVWSESFINSYINKNIEVSLECTSIACDSITISKEIVDINWTWSLSITDKFWRVLTKHYKISKINKTKPVWNLSYTPDNNIWINWERIVTLTWEAQNWDWLIWNSSPSIWSNENKNWILWLKDSAWNTLFKSYNIKKIDRINPIISIKHTSIVENWKEKIIIKCSDTWWSTCLVVEQEYWLEQWISTTKCVYDKAWNTDCMSFNVSASVDKYRTDNNLNWTNGSRYIWMKCLDEIWWSWCVNAKVSKTLIENTTSEELTISDKAGHSVTKIFQISKIDKVYPNVYINWLYTFKASDTKRITISFDDALSWIKETKYNWDNSCRNWNNLLWNSIENNTKINYTVSWNHTLYVCSKDNAWNIEEKSQVFTIYPWDLDESKTLISVDSNWDKFANNKESYIYTLTLKDKYWNLIHDKNIKLVKQTTDTNNYFLENWSNNINWEIKFYLKSLYPFESFKQSFKVDIEKWDNNYVNNWEINSIIKIISEDNSFKKPLVWEFQIIEWWTISEIWKDQKYKIKLIKKDSNNLIIDNNSIWKLNISQHTIKNNITWHIWNWNFSNIDNSFWNNLNNYVWFIWKIDANDNILKSPVIKSNNLEVSYRLWWKNIRYYLDNFTSVWNCDLETLWLKVIWTLQWDWKLETIANWNWNNFSDLSKWKIRSKIRKNAYTSIRNRSSNKTQNINNMIYFEGDINYLEVKNYLKENDTIVIKNWNFFIDDDIEKNIWIIVLKDNFNVNSDYENNWNIYVKSDVLNINAIIYADWVFRSANSSWDTYNDNNLNEQLNLYWSLFTRNTIWWAVKANSSYTLPWWKEVTDYDLAEVYDLNYIRKVSKTCDWNDENDYSFIIKYNPSIQNNPPKLFGQ